MKNSAILIMLLSLILFSCAKDGEPGPPGKDGADGNANVVSVSKTILPAEWVITGSEGIDLMFYASISVPQITSSILDSGTVVVFYTYNDGTFFEALPATFYFGDFDKNITYTYDLSRVIIWIADSDLLTTPPEFDLNFRIVVIAGNLGNKAINSEDYEWEVPLLAK